jgi:hypothetical protein
MSVAGGGGGLMFDLIPDCFVMLEKDIMMMNIRDMG